MARGIALNFFPITTPRFSVAVYCAPFIQGERPDLGPEGRAVQRSLELDGNRRHYWTAFDEFPGAQEVVCAHDNNIYLTLAALHCALLQQAISCLEPGDYAEVQRFRAKIEFTVTKYPEGKEIVSVRPYYLRSQRKLGFLAAFHFHPAEGHQRTRRALELSLSLDRNGQPNLNYYADQYSRLANFVNKYHGRLFPLTLPAGDIVQVGTRFVEISPKKLELKHYLVGRGAQSNSQFMGVKNSGPYAVASDDTQLYFLYSREHHSLSRDLYRALRGDTFQTFAGMKDMFHLSISRDNVKGAALDDFSERQIMKMRDRVVVDAAGRSVVPIVLTPFGRHDEPVENAAYWTLKHAFLSVGLPIQVVASKTIADRNTLKWSTAGIGLQVFAKAGGTPWKVRPRLEKCLIVGVGQAHKVTSNGIERFFAYSVLTDSSGVLEEIRVLGEGVDEAHYTESFSQNLSKIFMDYAERFSSFVVHATFGIRKRELDCIAQALADRGTEANGKAAEVGEFASLRFNDAHDYFGFAPDHNSLVPFESTVARLSDREYLVWFGGLQYGQATVRKMVGGPLHVKFTYPSSLSSVRQEALLQDAINLSGANWRGFNAKTLPVSVYYAQLIAKYLREFERHGLRAIDVNILSPWFL